jgi:hypothetical protein
VKHLERTGVQMNTYHENGQANRPACKLIRVPASGQLRCVALGGEIVQIPIHFYWGRSYGCTGEDCPLCNRNITHRMKTYLSVQLATKPGRVILELPAAAATEIIDRWKHDELRGALLTCERCTSKKRGRVVVSIDREPMHLPNAAAPAEVAQVLLNVWGYPPTSTTQSTNDHVKACNDQLEQLIHEQAISN